MNTSTKDSHAIHYATLAMLALLAVVLLARPRFLTASAPPTFNQGDATAATVAVSPAYAVPALPDAGPAHANPLPETAALPGRNELPGTTGFSEADRSFLQAAAKVGAQKYEISSQALSHLIYPEVREYAGTILDGHNAFNAELTDLAARKGVVIPAPVEVSLPKPKRDDGSLDRRYVTLMAEGNQEVIQMYEQAARSGDAEIAAFARKMLPVLRQHLNTARDLEKVTE